MVYENGENWEPIAPDKRGRHASFASALDAALADMTTEHDPFFDSLAERWRELFPGMPIRPGRYEGGRIYLYVANAPTSFAMRPKMPAFRRRLAELPGAPKKMDLKLEIRK